jgi:hypothetical protein
MPMDDAVLMLALSYARIIVALVPGQINVSGPQPGVPVR